MARSIKFEGVTRQFPDDATDEEISAALGESSKPDISHAHGTEKLPGGVAPGVDKPGLPKEKQEFTGDSYGSELPMPSHNFATDGASKMKDGVAAISNGRNARGVSDLIRGAGEMTGPITTGLAMTNPVSGIKTLAGGIAGEYMGRGTADLFGAGADTKDAVGDLTGIAGGGIAASPKTIPFIKGAAKAIPRAVSDNFGAPMTIHNLMHSKLPIPAAIGTGIGYLTGHPIAGGVVGGAAGSVPAIVRGGMRESQAYPWLPKGRIFSPEPTPQQRLLGSGPIITEPPVDGSFVRGAPAMAHPPNPARALPAAGRVIEMPPAADSSYVRGVPGTFATPEPRVRGLLPAAQTPIITPAPADTSYVRGIRGEYPEVTPRAPKPVQDSGDMSDILQRSIDQARSRKPVPMSDTVPEQSKVKGYRHK